jgi:hypothetical protein
VQRARRAVQRARPSSKETTRSTGRASVWPSQAPVSSSASRGPRASAPDRSHRSPSSPSMSPSSIFRSPSYFVVGPPSGGRPRPNFRSLQYAQKPTPTRPIPAVAYP